MEFQLCILEEDRKGGVHNLWSWGVGGGGVGGVGLGRVKGVEAWRGLAITNLGYPASSGFSRPDATLRRERNHCEHPSASLIEPPSSAMDE